jgi:hypothetical protein
MGKNRPFVKCNSDGNFMLKSDTFSTIFQIWAETAAEKFELVRTTILGKGLVITEKLEKKVRKELKM